MSCMCGDLQCPSCGPAQGNFRCPACNEWADEGCDCTEEDVERAIEIARGLDDDGTLDDIF